MSQDIEDRDPFLGRPKCWLVGVRLGARSIAGVEEQLDELEGLTGAAGGRVAGRTIQNRNRLDPGSFIGRGKAEKIGQEVRGAGVDLVIFDDDLTGSQIRVLEELTDAVVMDRSGLILEIFHQRARTAEARTQVELARLRYLLPRLTARWSHLSRQQGGIGVRGGEGETQLEADRRMLRTRIARLKRDLESIERTRAVQRGGRDGTREVALAGYTNAGKSTLFNRLTGADAMVQDQVFATLDSKLRRGYLVAGKVALFADTVGFIRKLPHHLVASFRSTMEQVQTANLVLHVVDSSHQNWREQQAVAEEVLRDLEVEKDRVILVHNKIDLASGRSRHPEAFAISATTGEGIESLKRRLADRLYGLSEDASENELWLQTATKG